jgi:hypothetical protein
MITFPNHYSVSEFYKLLVQLYQTAKQYDSFFTVKLPDHTVTIKSRYNIVTVSNGTELLTVSDYSVVCCAYSVGFNNIVNLLTAL